MQHYFRTLMTDEFEKALNKLKKQRDAIPQKRDMEKERASLLILVNNRILPPLMSIRDTYTTDGIIFLSYAKSIRPSEPIDPILIRSLTCAWDKSKIEDSEHQNSWYHNIRVEFNDRYVFLGKHDYQSVTSNFDFSRIPVDQNFDTQYKSELLRFLKEGPHKSTYRLGFIGSESSVKPLPGSSIPLVGY